jgi:hypothetical protein
LDLLWLLADLPNLATYKQADFLAASPKVAQEENIPIEAKPERATFLSGREHRKSAKGAAGEVRGSQAASNN